MKLPSASDCHNYHASGRGHRMGKKRGVQKASKLASGLLFAGGWLLLVPL
jgi:hypothetical protein